MTAVNNNPAVPKVKTPILPKVAGALAIVSGLHDIHKTAMIHSKNALAKASSDHTISNSINYQKADRISFRDTQRKNWLSPGNITAPFVEIGASVGGYIMGALKTATRYIPSFVCATIAIVAKTPKIANIATVLLGCVEAFDFARHSLGFGQRNDYLK